MTRQILRTGLKALIIGKDGNGYGVRDWPLSNTFRLSRQENLIIADNQTRRYHSFSDETKLLHTLISWGEEAADLPKDYPDLGIPFRIDNAFGMHSSHTQVST